MKTKCSLVIYNKSIECVGVIYISYSACNLMEQ